MELENRCWFDHLFYLSQHLFYLKYSIYDVSLFFVDVIAEAHNLDFTLN